MTCRRRCDCLRALLGSFRRAPQAVLEGRRTFAGAGVFVTPSRALVEPYLEYGCRTVRTRIGSIIYAGGRVSPCAGFAAGRAHDLAVDFRTAKRELFFAATAAAAHRWEHRVAGAFWVYDPGPNQIVLNRRMDLPGVPQFCGE